MATTVTATEHIQRAGEEETAPAEQPAASSGLKLGVRARQIALITLLVALVVAVTTAVNIANLTEVIITRTAKEARQVSNQINYAVNLELAEARTTADPVDPYTSLVIAPGVRGLMESTMATTQVISYLYLANVSGQIIADSEGRRELAANRHMIGEVPTDRPNLDQLANQNGYVQLARLLFGDPIYEYQKRLEVDESFAAELHIGVSASTVRRELLRPIATNLIIGLVAIIVATIVAVGSANLLLRPLEAISTSIDQLGLSDKSGTIDYLPQDEMVTGVTS
ncbi:MAG TPA: hypothetical protein VLG74_03290, partial [Blastocatellia bacterium]|nr:hypothetical protein [Blastocatellia bacterium]